MKRFFNPENKFWEFLGKLTDVACLSLLWFITSVPIITMGAATTAFCAFTMRQVNDTEGMVWSGFFKAFRQHWKKATVLWLVHLAGLLFFAVDLYAAWCYFSYTGGSVAGIAVFAAVLCLTILFVGCSFYLYPTLAVFDFPVKKILGNSFVMAVGNLPVTVTLFLLLALMYYGIYELSGFFFFMVGLYIFVSSYLIFGVFRKYTGEQAEDDELRRQQKEEKARLKKQQSDEALQAKMNRLRGRM